MWLRLSDEAVAYRVEEEQHQLSPYALLGETVMGKTLVQGKERGAWILRAAALAPLSI